jgi:hypothetical protein
MPGRIYSAQFSGQASAAQVDFFELNAPADGVVELLELHLGNQTEVGDTQEEMLLIAIKSGQTTSGSGGATPTAVPRQLGDSAFGGTVETFNTTKASAGTIVTHEVHAWNVRVPFTRIWTPETTIIINPSGRLTVELGTTPADSITYCGTIVFREIGG